VSHITFYDEGNELNGEWTDRRVLVTGGTGFLGQHLTRRLVERGAKVTVTLCDSDGPEQIATLPQKVGRLDGDVRHEEQMQWVIETVAPDTVFHLAAVGVNDFFIAAEVALQVNLHGTLNLLRAVQRAGVRRIVVAGTCYEYGEGSALDPGNVYAASKVAAWAFCRMHYRAFGTPVVVVRPFNVYGPGQDERALIPSAIRAALSGQDFPTTPGEQQRDFIYVDDLIEGFLCVALADGVEGQSLDLGTGQATAIREVARRIFDLVGVPERLQVGALPYRPGVVWELVADAARTTRLTGWRAQVGLEQGLRATIEEVKHRA
jgi:nucleoside-diphosphate-sugar epimerase